MSKFKSFCLILIEKLVKKKKKRKKKVRLLCKTKKKQSKSPWNNQKNHFQEFLSSCVGDKRLEIFFKKLVKQKLRGPFTTLQEYKKKLGGWN